MILGLYFPSGLSVKQVTQHVQTLEQFRKRKVSQSRLFSTLYGQYFYLQFPSTEYLINIRAVHLDSMTSLGRHPRLTGSLSAISKVQLRAPVIWQKRSRASGNRPIDPNYAKWFGIRQKRHICQIFLCTSLLSDGNIFPYLGK